MFSYEDRIKAVKLYIESGLNESTVVRVLGYPSYTTLRYWYKEYLTTGDLHQSSIAKPRYTKDQKIQAIEYYCFPTVSKLYEAVRIQLGYYIPEQAEIKRQGKCRKDGEEGDG